MRCRSGKARWRTKMEIDGAAGDLTIGPRRVAQHRAAQAILRRAGFLGHHPPRDKEHHLASRKCRRESTPQTPGRVVAIGVLAASTPWLVRSDRPSSIVAPNRHITRKKQNTLP